MATARIGKGGTGRSRNSSSPIEGERTPSINWTPERQQIWLQMKADYDANPSSPATMGGKLYKTAVNIAANPPGYGTHYQWMTWLYQVTGDVTYATQAWETIEVDFILPFEAGTQANNANFHRENPWGLIMALDWLWPTLSVTNRDRLIAQIGDLYNKALGGSTWVAPGFYATDSDQLIAYYFGTTAFYHLVPTDVNAAYWYNFVGSPTGRLGHGGLTATASDRSSTARNALKQYVEVLAEGGEWLESSEYNAASVVFLLQGYDAVHTLMKDGVDYYPELTAWFPELAKRSMATWTQDFESMFKWGDTEHPYPADLPHDLFHWTQAMSMLAGVLSGTTEGGMIMDFLDDLYDHWGYFGYGTAENQLTFGIHMLNPYHPRVDRSLADKTFYAPGTGTLIQKSGYDTTDSLFAISAGNRADERYLDHYEGCIGNFSLWKNNEWVIDHPQVYGVPVHAMFTKNSPIMQGLGWCYEYNHIEHEAHTDDYAYLAQTTAGCQAGWAGYYDPPPVTVHEWTREIFDAKGSCDTIIINDRAHVTATGVLTRYPSNHQTAITNAPSRKQWMFNIPSSSAPTYSSSRYNWSTPISSTPVRWYPLLPATQTRTLYGLSANNEPVIDWNKVYASTGSSGDVERQYFDQVRIWPTNVQDFDTFLNVFQVGNSPGAVTLIEDAGKVQGVHVVRPAQNDLVVLFNSEASAALNTTSFHASHDAAIPLQRFRETGFTISFTATTASTDVYMNDLNPANAWTLNIDGGGANALGVDTGGHVAGAGLAIGTGPHTFVVVGS
jgi:hypothetical protein